MIAGQEIITRFLESKDNRFIVPIYQRNYEWQKYNCEKLFEDLLDIIKNDYRNHFFGSIVISYNSRKKTNKHEFFIIDGQQRLTTICLLFLAIINCIEEILENNKNISLEEERKLRQIKDEIKNEYLVDRYDETENKIKLKPIKKDRGYFEELFFNANNIRKNKDSNITKNYNYFYERIKSNPSLIYTLKEAVSKLVIISMEIDESIDDAQLIFESINSTGIALTEADKIRNLIFMGEEIKTQEQYFENYWSKIELNTDVKLNDFVSYYLTVKTYKKSNNNEVFFDFKEYIKNIENKEIFLKDMLKYSEYYTIIKNYNVENNNLKKCLYNINKFGNDMYPYLMHVFNRRYENKITDEDMIEVFKIIESYLFRRVICGLVQTGANKLVFPNLEKYIIKIETEHENYVKALQYTITSFKNSTRFPHDFEFMHNLRGKNVYDFKYKNHLFCELENYKNKEYVDIERLTNEKVLSIEHIMPQKLSTKWKNDLGENWDNIYETYLNSIGNLTLTAYNSEMGNLTFKDKKKKGFMDSKFKLNQSIKDIDIWNEEAIINRREILIKDCLEIWEYPKYHYSNIYIEESIMTLDDDINVTRKKIKRLKYKDKIENNISWTDFYCFIIKETYCENQLKIMSILNNEINKINKNRPVQVIDDIIVDVNLSAEAIVKKCKILIEEADLELSDFELELY